MKYLTLKKMLFLALTTAVLFSSCFLIPKEEQPDPIYEGFYNYPIGRESSNGTLTITNSAVAPALLFTDSVSPTNYIGTVGSLSSIKVKLPDEKFYTIVAVDKAKYEDKGADASQFSNLTYYSDTQYFSITVSNSTTGQGKWTINNNSDYWVSLRKADQSVVYAVVAPNAKRVIVSVEFGVTYDFIPHFYKEVKEKGKVVGLIESDYSDDIKQADTVITSKEEPSFVTDIGGPEANIELPKDTQPAIFVVNNSDKTVRVYSGQHKQLLNAAGTVDFALATGRSQLFMLEPETNVNDIQFSSIAWDKRVYVTEDIPVQINKVYKIELKVTAGVYSTVVTEEEAEGYFN